MTISLIAAYALPSRAIGFEGHLPWREPRDLAWFKAKTMGKTIVFGSTTYKGLVHKKLQGRTIWVLSRQMFDVPSLASVEAVINEAQKLGLNELVFAGGAKVYEACLPYVNKLYLTEISRHIQADTYMPSINLSSFDLVSSEVVDELRFMEFVKT